MNNNVKREIKFTRQRRKTFVTHKLKIYEDYFIAIIEGLKTFEVRENDRDFQVGDCIYFQVIDSSNDYILTTAFKKKYVITYILKDFEGLKDNYVVLGIEEEDV